MKLCCPIFINVLLWPAPGQQQKKLHGIYFVQKQKQKKELFDGFLCVRVCPEGVLRNIDFIAGKNKNGNWPQRRMCHNTKEEKRNRNKMKNQFLTRKKKY
jgi:hypothetical protein